MRNLGANQAIAFLFLRGVTVRSSAWMAAMSGLVVSKNLHNDHLLFESDNMLLFLYLVQIDENGLVERFVNGAWEPQCFNDSFTFLDAQEICASVGLGQVTHVSSLDLILNDSFNSSCLRGQKVICESFDCKLVSHGSDAVQPHEIKSMLRVHGQEGEGYCLAQILSPVWLLSTNDCLM